jgi:S-methylmethionine-dependent homocysteine/selenocysteine methylase
MGGMRDVSGDAGGGMSADLMTASLPLLLDGGMGRELWYRGIEVPNTIWSAQALVDAPEVVRDIHRDYILAGADVITTNTYAVRRESFTAIGLGDQFESTMVLACTLAIEVRETSGREVFIAGSIAPLRGSYRPDLVGTLEEILPLYREQVGLMAPYVDLFLCETMSSAAEAFAAATAATESGKAVWVSWTLDDAHPDRLKSGETIAEAAQALAGLEVAGLLVNCCKPETIATAMPEIVATGKRFVGGYANTFEPPPPDWMLQKEGLLGLRTDLDPETYAGFVRQWLDAGATVVGGCCGTRPAHIERIARMLQD